METIQIELKNKNALSILKSLEKAKMIRVINSEKQAKNSLLRLKGSFSPERAIELANEVEKSNHQQHKRLRSDYRPSFSKNR